MTGYQGHGAPAPGWYADPGGQAGVRWWDGVQWTAHTAPLPAGAAAPVVTGPRTRLPETTPVYTPYIWVIVLLPLISAASVLLLPTFRYVMVDGAPIIDLHSVYTPGYFAAEALGLLVLVAYVVLSALDRRTLVRVGVVRPFHWAWAFFCLINPVGCMVYAIGRSVVVHQVARPRGLAPIWVMIAAVVVNVVVSAVWIVAYLAPLFSQLSRVATAS